MSCFSPYTSSPWVVRYTNLQSETGVIYTPDSNILWCAKQPSGNSSLIMINASTYAQAASLVENCSNIGIVDVGNEILVLYRFAAGMWNSENIPTRVLKIIEGL